MPESITCRSWCQGHEPGEDDCQLRRTVLDEDPSYMPDTMEGMPREVNNIRLNAWQDQESEEPFLQLDFWRTDDPRDEPICVLTTGLTELEHLHRRIGEAIQALRQG
ncbi:hypothetical protein [Pseudarthrobacter sp. LT1]|uniref:hypothetical protein n=1 Tax=Pseudarthrobacter sp. LT1 TaxID=3111450 RepID=UPI002D793449|nr:hypothetical protein [Pseudarthrobacter sp. LT1]WRT15604.1 hypothetical protein VIK36_09050 [Pseudarthrobacter sp. LT1]